MSKGETFTGHSQRLLDVRARTNEPQSPDFWNHNTQHPGTRSPALSQCHGIRWDALESLREHRKKATEATLMVN